MRLIYFRGFGDRVAPTPVVSLHWSRVPERIAHKVAALTYKVIHDIAPRHLGPLDRVADVGRLKMQDLEIGK